jgi:serine/threonine protein kinase
VGDPVPPALAGTRFEIVRCLGEGGMGVVYEAIDREQGARVALKLLRTGRRGFTASALLRFKNEFRAIADLHHPNLVALGELFEVGGEWFFTMELVEGVDFIQHVRPDAPAAERAALVAETTVVVKPPVEGSPAPPLPPFAPVLAFDEARLRDALGQLAVGVAALHAAGMVHRDIKPSNIRVTAEGRVVLLDFGLVHAARQADELVETNQVVGSLAYMAPEQIGSARVAPEADWYAVGALLYQALLGRPPHTGSPHELIELKRKFAPPSPRAFLPAIPADLDDLCRRLV